MLAGLKIFNHLMLTKRVKPEIPIKIELFMDNMTVIRKLNSRQKIEGQLTNIEILISF
jgi:hypothetical protein